VLNTPQTPQNIPKQPQTGGSLTVIELDETTATAEQLLQTTKQLLETQKAELFTYDQKTTCCTHCKKVGQA
jgi:anaerobic ribonucleoside-triphosphate reductase